MTEQITMAHLTQGARLKEDVEEEQDPALTVEEFSALLLEDVDSWLEEFGCSSGLHDARNLHRHRHRRYSYMWVEEGEGEVYLGYEYKLVQSEGGHEGGGEHVERIYEIHKDGQTTGIFFELDGFYSSYEGIEWNDFVARVYPHQVMVTKYLETPAA